MPQVTGRRENGIAVDGGEPVMVDDEHIELAWFTVEDARALPDLALDEYAEMFRLVT